MQSVASNYKLEESRRVLSEADMSPMTALVVACDVVTQGACFAWEVESILHELEDTGCLPKENPRDRLLAGLACLANPAYLWDAGAFMAVTQTLNGQMAIPAVWEPLSPAQIAYALNELNFLNSVYNGVEDLTPLYGEGPKVFMAGCLFEGGFPECPEALSLCSEQLKRFYSAPTDLQDDVANPILQRKHREIKTYLDTLVGLRAKKMSGLRK
jgi:hypothetical protein